MEGQEALPPVDNTNTSNSNSRRDSQNQQAQDSWKEKTKYTPRKIGSDAGSLKQTAVREQVALDMRNEMLTCSPADFLNQYLPFLPDSAWVDRAFISLWTRGLLVTSVDESVPATKDVDQGLVSDTGTESYSGRITRSRSQARRAPSTRNNAIASNVDEQPEGRSTQADQPTSTGVKTAVVPPSEDEIEWKSYQQTSPKSAGSSEMTVFKHLKTIVDALHGVACSDISGGRELNGYYYMDCPSRKMDSEIAGADFQVDAVIARKNIYSEPKDDGQEDTPAAATTAVAMEFKKSDKPAMVVRNRKQLVSAANHIMNDDPRRNWMYGVTIEDTKLSLWYFSRSFSMKSQPLDFTKDIKTFIRIFLCFLYASESELGYDPTIYRKQYCGSLCYIYTLETVNGLKYFRTIEPLYNPRTYCITGRKSRVWSAIEIPDPNELEELPGAHEVALKDSWVDKNSLTEKEIQARIFRRLSDVEESDYAWARSDLKEMLRNALANPARYFMEVVHDWRVGENKERSAGSKGATHLFRLPEESFRAKLDRVAKGANSTASLNYYPSSHSHTSNDVPGKSKTGRKRKYAVKEHYRVVYNQVGKPLSVATSLYDSMRVVNDIFIALVLLYLAGWVHRDISPGNIIMVGEGKTLSGKLSDLEYARDFEDVDRVVSSDPKTGTPFFMPLEIHTGSILFVRTREAEAEDEVKSEGTDWSDDFESSFQNAQTRNSPKPAVRSTKLRYNFTHDMESLWWIILWIIVFRVKDAPGLTEAQSIFTNQHTPSAMRRDLFTLQNDVTLAEDVNDMVHDSLRKRRFPFLLDKYHEILFNTYWQLNSKGRKADTVYRHMYRKLAKVAVYIIRAFENFDIELCDPQLVDTFDGEFDLCEDRSVSQKRPRETDDEDEQDTGLFEDSASPYENELSSDGEGSGEGQEYERIGFNEQIRVRKNRDGNNGDGNDEDGDEDSLCERSVDAESGPRKRQKVDRSSGVLLDMAGIVRENRVPRARGNWL